MFPAIDQNSGWLATFGWKLSQVQGVTLEERDRFDIATVSGFRVGVLLRAVARMNTHTEINILVFTGLQTLTDSSEEPISEDYRHQTP